MLKIPNRVSVIISLIGAYVLMAVLVFLAIVMPPLTEMLINLPDNIGLRGEIAAWERVVILIVAYLILAVAALADFFLLGLLRAVRRGRVFSEKSVAYLRGVSWSCFVESVLFLFLGLYFQLSLGVAFAAAFVGICLRVVKNVIEEATEIKAEHDFTI